MEVLPPILKKMKTTAKDFFLHLAAMVSLYAGTIALLNLLFRVINVAYPQIDRYFFGPSISLPVAVLIVVFPLFLFLNNVLRKSYEQEPERKQLAIRRWLVYITLFVTGIAVSGDLITLIYFFLDGRELTAGFLLKVLAVLVVAGGLFSYFLQDLKDGLTPTIRNYWRILAGILVIGSIIAGFTVIGSPRSQRMIRFDADKISDLQSIQWQIINYWQQKGSLPETLTDLTDPISGYNVPKDPQSKEDYRYRKVKGMVFELCADFNIEATSATNLTKPYMMGGEVSESWMHKTGMQCFERTIDPKLYPVRIPGLY